jgi:hypothetical protein
LSQSFNLRNIREGSGNAPLEKEVNRIARVVARNLASQQIDLVDEPEDIFPSGIDVETSVKFHDELTSANQFYFDKAYYPCNEPDYNKVQLMLKGKSQGNLLKDFSGYGRHATEIGEPILVDGGPFDPGFFDFGVKSRALRFNRPTSQYAEKEYLTVPDATGIRISGATSGISYMFRYRPMSLESQEGNFDPRVFEKTDDNTPNYGVQVRHNSEGRYKIVIKYNGTEIIKHSATGTIVAGNVYTHFLTFNPTGNVVKLYRCIEPGNTLVDVTLSDTTFGVNWHSDLTGPKSKQLTIFNRSTGSEGEGDVYADFYNLYIYRQKIVSSTEAQNLFTNKITIYPQPYGQCMVTNHCATNHIVAGPTGSFTDASFTTGSFT